MVCRVGGGEAGCGDGPVPSHGPVSGTSEPGQGLCIRLAQLTSLSLCAGNKRSSPPPSQPANVRATFAPHGTRYSCPRIQYYLPYQIRDLNLRPSNPPQQAAVQHMRHVYCRTSMVQAFIRTSPFFITRISAYRDAGRDDGGPAATKNSRLSSPARRTREVIPWVHVPDPDEEDCQGSDEMHCL